MKGSYYPCITRTIDVLKEVCGSPGPLLCGCSFILRNMQSRHLYGMNSRFLQHQICIHIDELGYILRKTADPFKRNSHLCDFRLLPLVAKCEVRISRKLIGS